MIATNLASPETWAAFAATLRDWAPAVANHLWQSTAFAALAAALAFALKKNHARARYWIWIAASLKFVLPFALLAALGSHFAKPHPAAPAPAAVYVAAEDFSEPFAPPLQLPDAQPAPAPRIAVPVLPLSLAALWFLGFATVLVTWSVQWMRASRLVRQAAPMPEGRELTALRRIEASAGLRRPIALRLSPSAVEPGVFGIMRPILAWPDGISARLDDAHLDAILAHEVCHVRRRDNLTAALHMFVEALFWFHPLVWWLGSRLIAERERACDEEVLTFCARPAAYAESILRVCAFCVESPSACISGVTGADLRRRVVDIMTGRAVRRLSLPRKILLAATAALVVAAPIVVGLHAPRRLVLAAMHATPNPLHLTAHAAIAEEETLATGELAQEAMPSAPNGNPDQAPRFDVATIRPSAADHVGPGGWMGVRVTGGLYEVRSMPLKSLVMNVYADRGARPDQVAGGGGWIDSQHWDITAKTDDPAFAKLSREEAYQRMRPLMRALLEERFHLKLHTEMRSTPVYALMQAKGGAKVKEVAGPPEVQGDFEEAWRQHMREHPGEPMPGGFMCTGDTCTASAVKISNAIGQIAGSSHADRTVVDETGLAGYYNFSFRQPRPDDDDAMGKVEEDLGMRFEPRKVDLKTYVIDSAEKPTVDGAETESQPAVQTSYSRLASFAGSPEASGLRRRLAAQEIGSATVAAPASALMKFDVVSIHPLKPGEKAIGWGFNPGEFDGNGASLAALLGYAYQLQFVQERVVGGPDWVRTQGYNIRAKVAPENATAYEQLSRQMTPAADAQRRSMLLSLLQDQFHLKTHTETRQGTLYALVLAKGGPKLKASTSGETPFIRIRNRQHLEVRSAEIAAMIPFFAQELGHPVVDRTGLAGKYDFTLDWATDRAEAGSSAEASAPTGPSIFTAVEEQLGLRLEAQKGPIDYLVIDHAEQPQTDTAETAPAKTPGQFQNAALQTPAQSTRFLVFPQPGISALFRPARHAADDWLPGGRIESRSDKAIVSYRVGWAYVRPGGIEYHEGATVEPANGLELHGTATLFAQHAQARPDAWDFVSYVDQIKFADGTVWQFDHKLFIDGFFRSLYRQAAAQGRASTPAVTYEMAQNWPQPKDHPVPMRILPSPGPSAVLAPEPKLSLVAFQTPIASSPAFEVVSIHRSLGGERHFGPTPDGWSMTNMPLATAILNAYAPAQPDGPAYFNNDTLTGLPDWAHNDRYDIVARIPTADMPAWQHPKQQAELLQVMLQHMLAERCGLVAHRDQKHAHVLNLVLAKGGPKFKASDPDAPHPQGSTVPGMGTVVPQDDGSFAVYGGTMAVITSFLSKGTGYIIQDRTGLSGAYDFVLKRPDLPLTNPTDVAPADPEAMVDASAHSLGLALVAAKGQVETLVIDRLHAPSQN